MYYNISDDERRSIWLSLCMYKCKMEKELDSQSAIDRAILEKIDGLLGRFSPKDVIE